jgi:hypothetical protein
MFVQIISGNSNVYQLDIFQFLVAQDIIAKKYMSKLEGNTDIEIMDKYMLQIIEEIWEVENSKNDVEYLQELCDVVMYLGSLYAIISNRSKTSYSVFENINFIMDGSYKIDLFDMVKDLMSVRRFFPERKWHKAETVRADISMDYVCLDIIKNCIVRIFKYLTSNHALYDFDFEKYLASKQKIK